MRVMMHVWHIWQVEGRSLQNLLLFWTDSLQIKIERDLKLFRIEGQGVDKEPKDVLAINERTGEITVKRPVDYEQFKVLKVRRNLLEQHQL